MDSEMYEFLTDNGMSRETYHFFLAAAPTHHCIMGNDYYVTNEHRVAPNGITRASGEIFGYDEITQQYFERYRLPVMHTETNLRQGPEGDEAVHWMWKQWASVLHVRNNGVPIVGFTWYSLTDQVDWIHALREKRGDVDPVGLYDLDRKDPAGGASVPDAHRAVARRPSHAQRVPAAPARFAPAARIAKGGGASGARAGTA